MRCSPEFRSQSNPPVGECPTRGAPRLSHKCKSGLAGCRRQAVILPSASSPRKWSLQIPRLCVLWLPERAQWCWWRSVSLRVSSLRLALCRSIVPRHCISIFAPLAVHTIQFPTLCGFMALIHPLGCSRCASPQSFCVPPFPSWPFNECLCPFQFVTIGVRKFYPLKFLLRARGSAGNHFSRSAFIFLSGRCEIATHLVFLLLQDV